VDASCAWGPAQERRRQEDEDEELARAIAASLGQELPSRGAAAASAVPAPPAPLAAGARDTPPNAAPDGAAQPQQKGARALAAHRALLAWPSGNRNLALRSSRCFVTCDVYLVVSRPAGSLSLWHPVVDWDTDTMPMCLSPAAAAPSEVAVHDGSGAVLARRVIASDNSCLFNAVGYVMEGSRARAPELRRGGSRPSSNCHRAVNTARTS